MYGRTAMEKILRIKQEKVVYLNSTTFSCSESFSDLLAKIGLNNPLILPQLGTIPFHDQLARL